MNEKSDADVNVIFCTVSIKNELYNKKKSRERLTTNKKKVAEIPKETHFGENKDFPSINQILK